MSDWNLNLNPGNGASKVMLVVKNPPANAGDTRDVSSIRGSGRSPGEGHGNPLQYSIERIPWTEEPVGLQSIVQLENNWTRLNQLSTHTHTQGKEYASEMEGKR